MKLLSILKAIQSRLEAVDGTGSFNTKIGQTVIRGQRQFSENELPASVCFMPGRSVEAEAGERAKLGSTVVIESHHTTGEHPEDTAIEMLADIQRAVELEDDTLGGLLRGRLSFVSDLISYPEDAGSYVSVQVVYSIPHVRHYGDPDK